MNIQTKKNKDALVVTVTGRMDAATSPEFEKGFAELLAKGDKSIIVDLAGLEYVSSAGLRAILTSAKRVNAAKGKLAFVGVKGQIQEVLKISGFLSILTVYATESEALAHL